MGCAVGVDVGTGSARAGVFDAQGRLLGSAKRDVRLHTGAGDVVEQSSAEIWAAVCASVRDAVARAGVDAGEVEGIGFDATCSLVLVGADGGPVAVGTSGDPARDVIVWMDHRAAGEAREINALRHPVLDYVGGAISPEMETPKLLWLKRNLPESFDAAAHFFDLTDYLTWRATGSEARSICTVTCKWTYLGHERRWDAGYFEAVGLGVLAAEGFRRIGVEVVEAGTALGGGLNAAAAAAMGLREGTPVGAGLIDAHAGGVATVGAAGPAGSVLSRMAYVMGTSACTMASSAEPLFVPGVWGPYYAAMVPGLWLNEGGQSAAGAAIDQLVLMHPASGEAARLAAAAGSGVAAWLAVQAAGRVAAMGGAAGEAWEGASEAVRLAGGMHVVPEFLGNRSPLADPGARAVIAGVGMGRSVDDLVGLYVAGLCGLGYGLRQIVEAMAAAGSAIDTVVISGGAGQLPLVRQLLADCAGVAVAAPESPEPVLLGAALLGAVAGGLYPDVAAAMPAMSRLGETHRPVGGALRALHERRYAAFVALQAAGRAIRD